MLLEQIRELASKLQSYEVMQRGSAELDKYQWRKKQLEAQVNRLRPLYTTLKLFRQNNIEVLELQTEHAHLLNKEFIKAHSLYKDNPQYVADESVLREEMKYRLPALAQNLEDVLKDAWNSYVDSRLNGMATNLPTGLAKIPTLAPVVTQINNLWQQIRDLSARLPVTQDDISAFHDALESLKRQMQALFGGDALGGLSPSVVSFIQSLGSGGASLDLLTDEVRDWLSEWGIEEYFHVVFKPS